MALSPLIIAQTELGMKFPQDPRYTADRLTRDMRDYVQAVDARFKQLEAVVEDLEARIIAGGL